MGAFIRMAFTASSPCANSPVGAETPRSCARETSSTPRWSRCARARRGSHPPRGGRRAREPNGDRDAENARLRRVARGRRRHGARPRRRGAAPLRSRAPRSEHARHERRGHLRRHDRRRAAPQDPRVVGLRRRAGHQRNMLETRRRRASCRSPRTSPRSATRSPMRCARASQSTRADAGLDLAADQARGRRERRRDVPPAPRKKDRRQVRYGPTQTTPFMPTLKWMSHWNV